jgi:arsenate reductase (thioredoxin)
VTDRGKKTILFLCTGNSCRSQMAEGFAKKLLSEWNVLSAGILAAGVHSMAIEVMREKEIDISTQTSKSINELGHIEPNVIITLCDHANRHCPHFAGAAHREHWSVHDPVQPNGSEKRIETFRHVRDDIENRIIELVSEING